MATSVEIAAFENFRFSIGDIVRMKADRATMVVIASHAYEYGLKVENIGPAVGIVTTRWLLQDGAGISRAYSVNGPYVDDRMLKEFELEPTS